MRNWVAVTMDGDVLTSPKKRYLVSYLAYQALDVPNIRRLRPGVYETQIGEFTAQTWWITNDDAWLRENGWAGDVSLLVHPSGSTATGAFGRLKESRGIHDRHAEVVEFNRAGSGAHE